MNFRPAPLQGVYVIELEPRNDERGFFARAFCEREFREHGLVDHFVQMNDSVNLRRGTLRGLHYQLAPDAEVKLVRCVRGSLFDVVVDLRPDSPTFRRWFGAELSAANRAMMYVPEGFAHGFVTLEDDVEALYLVSQYYSPGRERGLRWNDPAVGVAWPLAPLVISDKDRNHPDFTGLQEPGVAASGR